MVKNHKRVLKFRLMGFDIPTKCNQIIVCTQIWGSWNKNSIPLNVKVGKSMHFVNLNVTTDC